MIRLNLQQIEEYDAGACNLIITLSQMVDDFFREYLHEFLHKETDYDLGLEKLHILTPHVMLEGSIK